MRIIHIQIIYKLNNIFINIIKNINSKIIWSQSLGKLGFKNKKKQLLEAFNLLLSTVFEYIKLNNLHINRICLNRLIPNKIKLIKNHIIHLRINEIIFLQNVSHNGCRIKKNLKKKRMSAKLYITKI